MISDPRNYLVVEAKIAGGLGMADNFINRSGWVRTAIELPPGAQPEAIAFQCMIPKRAGSCRLEAVGKVLKLTSDYRPGDDLAPQVSPTVLRPGEISPIPLPLP